MDIKMKMRLCSVVASVAIMTVAGGVSAKEGDGMVVTKLSQLFAVEQNGTLAPNMDAECKAKYSDLAGKNMTVKYQTLPKEGIVKVVAMFMGTPVQLFPMGIAGEYDFTSDQLPKNLKSMGIMRETFELDKNLRNPVASVMTALDASYNCMLSNIPPSKA